MSHARDPRAPTSPSRRDHLAIALVSAALLVFQIALTRILSVVAWYHFAYLTLSLVMLGLAAPGVWFALARRPDRWLPAALFAGGVTPLLTTVLLVRFGTSLLELSPALLVAVALPPMLALGAALVLLLLRAPGAAVGRMYAWDLAGGAVGALAVIPLLTVAPTPHVAAGTGLLAILALALLHPRGRAVAAAGVVLLAAVVIPGEPLTVTRSKDYDERETAPIYERWTPLARITVFDETFFYLEGHDRGFAWGRGERRPSRPPVRQYWLEQDGSAGTPITAFDGRWEPLSFLLEDVTTAGLQIREPGHGLVVGAGGGRDALAARVAGADSVTAVELNPRTLEVVNDRFGELSGRLYDRAGIRAVAAEGRSFLTRTPDRYDLIQISLTDSWAASTAGTYALAENNLYTVEAFRLYLDRLTPTGLLSVSRWMSELPWLLGLVRETLRAEGREPARHVAVVTAGQVATVLVTRDRWTGDDTAALGEVARTRGFTVQYPVAQGLPALTGLVEHLLTRDSTPLAERGYLARVPTDDRPYFFHVASPFRAVPADDTLRPALGQNIFSTPVRVLRHTLVAVAVAAGLFLLVGPSWVLDRSRAPRSAFTAGTLYFAAIGAAFLLVETVLIQRLVLFLGHPAYATTVVVAGLLLGMGAGSLAAPRLGAAALRRWGWMVPVWLALLVLALPAGIRAGLGGPLGLRIAASLLALVPTGMLLGVFFPLGLIRFPEPLKAWFWSVNGFFATVAGVLSLALSMEFGFGVVGWLAVALYLGAWVVFRTP